MAGEWIRFRAPGPWPVAKAFFEIQDGGPKLKDVFLLAQPRSARGNEISLSEYLYPERCHNIANAFSFSGSRSSRQSCSDGSTKH